MRAPLEALTAFEVAVRCGGTTFARLQPVVVHRQAHGAAGLAPVEARFLEDLVQAFRFRLFLDEAGARNDHRRNGRGDLAAFDHLGDGAQVLDAAIGAGADEHPVDGDIVIFVPGFRPI